MSSEIKLYDANNIDGLPWPNSEEGNQARLFLPHLMKKGVKHFIDNVDTTLQVLTLDDLILPFTINDTEYNNSYVCSPYGYYILYAKEALGNISNRFLKKTLAGILWGLDKTLKIGKINKVIIVNNSLFSTDLHPHLTPSQVALISKFLTDRFPEHAIVFRSINTYKNDGLYRILKSQKYGLIPSRPIYFIDTHNPSNFTTRIFKSDLKALRDSTHHLIKHEELQDIDIDRITALYNAVYLEKHSKLNPQLNRNFMELALKSQILNFQGFKENSTLNAIAAYYSRNGVMMSPLVGYDTSLSKDNKLYRLTCTALTLTAKEKGIIFHLSSGASFYKKIRKAEANLEYTAVYYKHLPRVRRLPWQILKAVMSTVGIPCMKRFF